jgi:DNA-binding NarL/FixJ family response regulator
VLLTTFDVDDYVYEALRAGASGFLLKSSPTETLISAIRTVAAGDALLDPAVTRRVIEQFGSHPQTPEPPGALGRLTERERDVLIEVSRGRSNAGIGRTPVISEATVKTHVAMPANLDLRDRVQAARRRHPRAAETAQVQVRPRRARVRRREGRSADARTQVGHHDARPLPALVPRPPRHRC